MSSELELLRQRISELETENADLRRKISEFNAERAELKRRIAEALRSTEETSKWRDAENAKLKGQNRGVRICVEFRRKWNAHLKSVPDIISAALQVYLCFGRRFKIPFLTLHIND
ncbi:hypothetical protein C1645_822616 [Glomus cerebriforme]|uniref:Uncharacterized protein n=1 Tax=Glomus cerebriforme TaxID=658196 RepID=A0A397SXV8_9GLOM|nr:hypothetical protein C1645_822616 [Glomus cerebriforme]